MYIGIWYTINFDIHKLRFVIFWIVFGLNLTVKTKIKKTVKAAVKYIDLKISLYVKCVLRIMGHLIIYHLQYFYITKLFAFVHGGCAKLT